MQTLILSNQTHFLEDQPVISVRNLNHYFGQGSLKKQALFDINLDIYSGEVVLMTGPSGSGKTTLLTLICGLRSPQEAVYNYSIKNYWARIRSN